MKTKILLVAIPAVIADSTIIEALSAVVVKDKRTKVDDLQGFILKDGEFIQILEGMGIKTNPEQMTVETKFTRAINSVLKAIPNFEPTSPAFRAEFHTLSIKGIIGKPILQIIAFGPTCATDVEFLKQNKVESIIDLAATALSLIESIDGKDL